MVFSLHRNLTAKINFLKANNKQIGLVPTMGALHNGHISLVKKALNENDVVVVSIFVNPTQFDNPNDLKKYPRTLKTDVDLLNTFKKDTILIYAPDINDIYESNVVAETFDFNGLDNEMEGAYRKGHFNGVATIVKRLFNIIKPDKAYFGEKDFQQLQIIRHVVKTHHLPVTIIGCAIKREPDGLAMSSRNKRLTAQQRNIAPFIYTILKTAKKKFGTKSANKVIKWVTNEFKKQPALQLEYFIIADEKTLKRTYRKSKKKSYRAFIAVYAGDIRLIDNIALN